MQLYCSSDLRKYKRGKMRTGTGRLKQRMASSWRMDLTFTGIFWRLLIMVGKFQGRYFHQTDHWKQKNQEGYTEWEWIGQRTGWFRIEWSRCHFILTILIHVLVCIAVWWFIRVVIFTDAVFMNSTLSKHWPSFIFSYQCQGGCNDDLIWFTMKLMTYN